MNEELTDAQCDELVKGVFNKLAATYDNKYGRMNAAYLNPDILEHDSLRRAIVREVYAQALTKIQRLEKENQRRADRCTKLKTALREVPEFQSAKTLPTIHDWGRWWRVYWGAVKRP